MANTKKVESELNVQAFNYYYSLGKDRSLRAVAERFGKSERTIANWSKAYNWMDRCAQRAIEDAESDERVAAQTDVKSKYRSICRELVDQFIEDFHNGKVRIQNIVDLERVAKLDLMLLDLPNDISATKVELSPETQKVFDKVLDEFERTFDSLKVR